MQYPNGQLIVIAHSKVSSEPTFESQLTAEFPIEHHYRADFWETLPATCPTYVPRINIYYAPHKNSLCPTQNLKTQIETLPATCPIYAPQT